MKLRRHQVLGHLAAQQDVLVFAFPYHNTKPLQSLRLFVGKSWTRIAGIAPWASTKLRRTNGSVPFVPSLNSSRMCGGRAVCPWRRILVRQRTGHGQWRQRDIPLQHPPRHPFATTRGILGIYAQHGMQYSIRRPSMPSRHRRAV